MAGIFRNDVFSRACLCRRHGIHSRWSRPQLQLREQRLLPEFAPTLLGLDVASVPRLLRCPHLAAQLLDAAAPLQTPLRSAN